MLHTPGNCMGEDYRVFRFSNVLSQVEKSVLTVENLPKQLIFSVRKLCFEAKVVFVVQITLGIG